MKFVTSNIKSNPLMSNAQVLHDLCIDNALDDEGGGVIGWQELAPAYYKADLPVALPAPWAHFNVEVECPISLYGGRFMPELNGAYTLLAHHGKLAVSPNRYISIIKTRRIHDGLKIAFVNTHMVSGAFTKAFRLAAAWRRKMWAIHYNLLKDTILALIGDGYVVVGMGDYNRTNVVPFHPNQTNYNLPSSIDQLFIIVDDFKRVQPVLLDSGEVGTDVLDTDHAALWAHVSLRAAAAPPTPGHAPVKQA